MLRIAAPSFAILFAAVGLAARAAEEPTVENALPAVVKTVPAAGAEDVDPGTMEIKVTFSKDMADESWSWVQVTEASFPKIDGKPRFDKDKRTCILPVKLEADKTYAIWINYPEKYENFKDRNGRAAVPYQLVFKTKK